MQTSLLLLLPAFLCGSSAVKAHEAVLHSDGIAIGTDAEAQEVAITNRGRLVRAEPESHPFWKTSLAAKAGADMYIEDVSLHKLEEVCKNPKPSPKEKWDAMAAMAHALNSLDAPYNIHGGTILGLVRGCYIFDYDIDYAIEHEWLKKNLDKAVDAIHEGGFLTDLHIFGDVEQRGYERSFMSHPAGEGSLLSGSSAARGQLKAALEASLPNPSDEGSLISESSAARAQLKAAFEASLHANQTIQLQRNGIKVDLFTMERASDHYTYGLWIDDKDGKSRWNPCTLKSTGTAKFSWLGVDVKVPVPLEDALISLYGVNYMTPIPWTWNVEPFTIGSCKHHQ